MNLPPLETLRHASALLALLVSVTGTLPAAAQAPGQWTQKASMPVATAEVGVAALDGEVYVVGGTRQEADKPPAWASTVNMAYDPARDTWRARAPLPRALTHVGLAALGGKLYAVGGFTNMVHTGPQSVAYAYDPKVDRWAELPAPPEPRGSMAVVAVGGRLHVLGGRKSSELVKLPTPPGAPEVLSGFGIAARHDVFDPATGRWSTAAPVPAPARDHVGVAVVDGRIHLFGGRTADLADNLARHDVYDPGTDQWTTAAPLPAARSAGAYTVLDGKILYAGGECKPGGKPSSPNTYDSVTAYDPATDRWTELAPLPSARHAFGADTLGRSAYFAGGAVLCGGGASTDLFAFTF